MVPRGGADQVQGRSNPFDLPQNGGPLDSLDWQAETIRQSLQQVFAYVQGVGFRNSVWYRRKKRSRQILSLWLRFASLSLLLAGGLCPLVPLGLLSFNPQGYGYLLLAAGGGLLLFDRLFGISSAWMRYMIATQEIELILERFRFDWLKAQVNQRDVQQTDAIPFLSLASETVLSLANIVQRETLEWTSEFQSNVAYLASMADPKRRSMGDSADRQPPRL
jgi:hypothetical protein